MKNKFLKSASIVIVYSLVAKFTSFFMELLVASNMGANNETDAFYMVYGIVQIIYPMISVGIWKVFLPEYKTRTVLGKHVEAFELTNQLLSIFAFIAIVIIVCVLLYPRGVILIFAPGFCDDTFRISEYLLKIVIFIILFNILATFSAAILQSEKIFSKSQLKDVVFQLPPLIYMIYSNNECTVAGLASSILIGSIVSAILTYKFVNAFYRYAMPLNITNRNIVPIIKQVPIACLNSIINQLDNVVDKAFASTLPIGAITYLNYGGKLVHLFDGILSTAISTAVFPYMTELIAKKEYEKIKIFFKNYIIMICVLLMPITFWLVFYSNEIVYLIYGHGKFDDKAVEQTALVMMMYGFGLIFMCITTILNDVFFILKKSNLLLMTSVANIIFNIILDFIFIEFLGVAGLSLATTVSLGVVLLIKLYYIRDMIRIDFSMLRIIACVFFCCVLAMACVLLCDKIIVDTLFGRFFLGTCVFFLVFSVLIVVTDKKLKEIFMNSIKNVFSGGDSI